MNKIIAALLEERDACVRSNKPDRVAAIDVELRKMGAGVPETAALAPVVERATAPKARKRKTDGDH